MNQREQKKWGRFTCPEKFSNEYDIKGLCNIKTKADQKSLELWGYGIFSLIYITSVRQPTK